MKMKTFDCVEMKRRGAEAVQQKTTGLSLEEELAYWEKGTAELQAIQGRLQLERKGDR